MKVKVFSFDSSKDYSVLLDEFYKFYLDSTECEVPFVFFSNIKGDDEIRGYFGGEFYGHVFDLTKQFLDHVINDVKENKEFYKESIKLKGVNNHSLIVRLYIVT
jgi:hypothetical protein